MRSRRQELSNGIAVLVAEVRYLPYVVVNLALPVGVNREPPQLGGLASLTAELLRRGAGGKSTQEIAEEIDSRGAQLSLSQGRDAMLVELRVLKKDLEWGFELLGLVLRRPHLDPEEFVKFQRQAIGEARSREEEPRERVHDLFTQTLMGEHPYGRPVEGTTASLARITADDVRAFHSQQYGPAGAALALAGDVGEEEALELTRRYFLDWTSDVPPMPLDPVRDPEGPLLAVEHHPVDQAKIVLGYPSVKRNDPDYYPVLVMNYIFGGSFRSRLTQNIRAASGLAYSVGSGFSARKERGAFRIGLQTQNEQANLALQEILKEVERIRTYPVSEAELHEARQAMIGGYPLRIDTLPEIAGQMVETEIYGLPEDRLADFRQGVESVTARDVQRVANRLFPPARLVIALAADLERANLKPVAELLPQGPVENVSLGPTHQEAAVKELITARPEVLNGRPTAVLVDAVPTEGLFEARLPNGLKVLMLENHKAPVATVQVWYGVGSRNERPGITGMSHFLEHMMFRGSPNFPDGKFDEVLALNGGINNAFTTEDFTAFYENMASHAVAVALELEADRMKTLVFSQEAFLRERDVIIEERRLRTEDSPGGIMFEQLHATAFAAHPYRWPVIGWMSDLERLSAGDMIDYYRTFYSANNATLVIAGDIEPRRLLPRIQELFGGIPVGPDIPEVRTVEPAQLGEKRYEVRKKSGYASILIGYHVPNLRSDDHYALDLLSRILAGGMSARLPRELVHERPLAMSAWSHYDPVMHDPGLFYVGAEFTPETSSAEVEAAVLEQLEQLKAAAPAAEELAKALHQWEAEYVMKQDDVEELANLVGAYETVDSWRHLHMDIQKMREVTPADIQRVACQYLVARNRTVGTLVPAEE
ncbi:MAG: insulinase family protein [Armatimonadetes bacterium]|nr:insulinase family protein [Armatimonadota bacterium]